MAGEENAAGKQPMKKRPKEKMEKIIIKKYMGNFANY